MTAFPTATRRWRAPRHAASFAAHGAAPAWAVALLLCAGLSVAQAQHDRGRDGPRHGASHAHPGQWHDRSHGSNRHYPRLGWSVTGVPLHSRVVFWGGVNYRYVDSVWYAPRSHGYVVVRPPLGLVFRDRPAFATLVTVGALAYLYANGVYYRELRSGGYEVVAPPGRCPVGPGRCGQDPGRLSGWLTPDIAARALAEAWPSAWGQTVVVENKPGASGNVAADAGGQGRRRPHAGRRHQRQPHLGQAAQPQAALRPGQGLHLLSLLATAPLVLVTPATSRRAPPFPGRRARAGDKWSYGSVGIGSVGHLGMEYLKPRRQHDGAVHVPYNGNPAVLTALMGGQIQMALMPPGLALPQVKAGKLNAVGVTGPRSTLAPEVPPLADAGVKMPPLEVWTRWWARQPEPRGAGPAGARRARAVRDGRHAAALLNGGWEPQGSAARRWLRVCRRGAHPGRHHHQRGIKLE
jgi:hypothetical protein